MALLPWDDEEDKDKTLLGVPTVKTVQSVQDSWQPAEPGSASGESNPSAQGQTPYLLSQEKAQADQQKRLKEAAEAARQAEVARQSQIASQQQVQDDTAKQQQVEVDKIKNDDGWKQYYDAEFKREKDGLDFFGRLLDGGQASRRAEVNARNKFVGDLNLQAYDDNGNVLDQAAADRARALSAYNLELAKSNGDRTRALSAAIGADKGNQDQNILDRVKSTINAEKNMNIFDALTGNVDDTQKFGIDDVGRFAGGLVQGIGTMPVIGAKELTEAISGRGTDAQTGMEDNLDASERIGRGVSGALNVVTPFVGGSGKLLDSLTSKVAAGVATTAEKTLLKELSRKILLPAIEQGAIGATQAGAEYFGDGGDLVDENGKLDPAKLFEFAKQTGTAGAMGFGGGALLSGAAMGVNKLRGRNLTPIDVAELGDLETRVTNSGQAQLSSVRQNGAPTIDLKNLEELKPFNPELPEPIADGFSTPDGTAVKTPNVDVPQADNNVTFQNKLDNSELGQPSNLLENAASDPTPVSEVLARPPEEITPVTENTPTTEPVVPETPVTDTPPAPVADGTPLPNTVMPETVGNTPVIRGEEARALREAKAGATQAEDAAINQELQNIDTTTPRSTLPDEMNGDITGVESDGTPLTRQQVAERLMPKLDDQKDVKQQIASAVGMEKDVESPIRDILRQGGVKEKQAERVATQFETLEKQLRDYNALEEANQKAYAEGGADALSEDVSRDRSRIARDMGTTQRRLMNEINRLEGSRDKKVALINNLADIIGTRNASVLTSAGLLERNIAQEITANLKLMAKNPGKMLKSTFGNGNIFKDTAKSELSHWKDNPGLNPVKIVKYVVGNTYRTSMIPTTALANTRRGAVREELTRWAYKELEGREISSNEAKKLSGAAGNEMEALVNTFIGVDNGMTNRKQATDALQAWKEYIRSGDDGAKAKFLEKVEAHSSLADQMINGLSREDQTKFRALKAMGNLIFPFVRTASNLARNTVRQDLNPMAKSLLDEIRADQRSGGNNAINLIKSKLVDYGIMGGAAALATSGVLVYNDGDDVDKPRGWSLKLSDNQYVPVRATALELPIALAGTAQAMASDIASGDARDWQYYAGMVTKSLPYIDQINTTTGAVDSLMGAGSDTGDGGYAIKSYGVNMAKSFVPFSNNGVQPYVEGKQGKSLNAKSSYDEDVFTWLKNTVQKSYDPEFYNSLKDSRDNAGRVRTVDNQGVISNKQINDANTETYNDDITALVEYGRENGLGKNTEDMFNSYDTGKNNNFKGIQDAITFLDVEEGADGKKSPKNEDKLKSNPKLSNLSQQIRDGFFGETGDELLTLDGKNLYSDVSAPNGAGSKNSRMPISMQSIKNAIAQTDLPEAERNRIYEISQADTALYNQLKNKEITYEQYSAEKAKSGQEYIDILSGSESYKKMLGLFDELDNTGFFEDGGMGSTRSGQTYLWNSLNALLGSKGATPAANYPDDKKGFTPWGNGNGAPASYKPGDRGSNGVQFTPVTQRQMAQTKTAKYTPFSVKVKLGNEIKKNKTQNYADKTF